MNNSNNAKMQIRENFSVDGTARSSYGSEPRGFFITRMALLTTVAIFSCLLIGTGLLIYHLAGCPDESGPVHASICDHHHFHHTFEASNLSRLVPHDTTSTEPVTITTSTASSPTTAKLDEHASGNGTDSESTTQLEDDADVRLPRSVEPLAYNVRLIPFMFGDNFTFAGTVDIEVRVLEDCDNITLHAVALKIHEAHVEQQRPPPKTRATRATGASLDDSYEYDDDDYNDIGGGNRTVVEIEQQVVVESKQFYVLKTSRKLRVGERYTVRIRYEGVLNDYLQGFYRSSYTVRNETR